MRSNYCCKYPGCESTYYKNPNIPNKSFFKFPSREEFATIWREICRIDENVSSKCFRLCADHFPRRHFRNSKRNSLNWNAIPSLGCSSYKPGAVVGDNFNRTNDENRISIGKDVQERWKNIKYSGKKSAFLLSNISENMNHDDTNNSSSGIEPSQDNSSCQSKRKQVDHFEPETGNDLNANTVYPTPHDPDPDETFLLSQMPLIKRMKLSEKLDFRIKFLQLVQSYTSLSPPLSTSPYYSSPTPSSEPTLENNLQSDNKSIIGPHIVKIIRYKKGTKHYKNITVK